MNLAQPNEEKKQAVSIFPYRPEVKYLAIFLPLIVSIPVVTTVIFYYCLLPVWFKPNPEEFQNIKGILVKYGALSSSDGEKFSFSNISKFSSNNNPITEKAVQLAQQDLGGPHSLLKLILPLVVVLATFIWITLRFRIPGVTRSIYQDIREYQEEHLDHIQDKTMDFLNDYSGVIITVNGFIISILGGFLINSGLNNFYFFLGFETIVFSLISSLLAYPAFISFSFIHKIKLEKMEKDKVPFRLYKPFLPQFFKLATFATVSLILGLMILLASFLMV